MSQIIDALQIKIENAKAKMSPESLAAIDSVDWRAKILELREKKGFTFGINPDSRVTLLAGWHTFAAGLQKEVPKPIVKDEAPAAKDSKAPARRNP